MNHKSSPPPQDPTPLTTAQLDRAIAALKEVVQAWVATHHIEVDEKFSHAETKILALRELITARASCTEEAITKADTAVNRQIIQFEASLGSLSKVLDQKVTKEEYAAAHRSLEQKIEALAKVVDRNEGARTGFESIRTTTLAILAMGVALVVGILHVLVK